jgi:hypothetical protein
MNNNRYMGNGNRNRITKFKKKLSTLNIESNEFMRKCENDFNNIMQSFLEAFRLLISMNPKNLNNSNLPNIKNNRISSKQINKSILHECKIYNYLKYNNRNFTDTYTCFLGCDRDNIYFKNCGITFEELILKNLSNFKLLKQILEKLFEGIHYLHLLGVTHNNLNCRNVLVGKSNMKKKIDVRLINFSQATIIEDDQKFDGDLLEKLFTNSTDILKNL